MARVYVCVMSNHAQLAPRGTYGPVLHDDALIGLGSPWISILIGVIMQGLLLVVLVELLFWNVFIFATKNNVWFQGELTLKRWDAWKTKWPKKTGVTFTVKCPLRCQLLPVWNLNEEKKNHNQLKLWRTKEACIYMYLQCGHSVLLHHDCQQTS